MFASVSIIYFVILLTFENTIDGRLAAIPTQADRTFLRNDSPSIPPVAAEYFGKKVVFVIGDGIPADVIESRVLPNLRDIQRIGRYTRAYVGGDFSTYTSTPTISAPGYMNLITGTWGNKHNVFDNDVRTPNYHYKNIFRLLKEQQPTRKIGIFSTWTDNRVKLIGEGLPTAGNIIFDYKFDGYELDQRTYPHDSAKRYIHNIDERVIHEASLCILNQAPDLSWIYLQYTDDMGHQFGDSQQFHQAVDFFDNQMGRIWQAIDYRRKKHNEDWLLIITTDHGRHSTSGHGHGGQSDRERTTWIVTNSPVTNMYSRQFQPAIVDILPTIARFMGLTIPLESEREIDGIPLLGRVSIVKPDASVLGNILTIKWQVVDDEGNVDIWLSTANSFQNGMKDRYDLVGTVPIGNKMATIDITKYPSEFYKIVLEGQYNRVNRWASRKDFGDCNGSRCGCYKGNCWAYADAGYTNGGDWWCYTQKAGVTGKQEKWQTCSQNDECSWERSCGSCRQYRREEEVHQDTCSSPVGRPLTDDCDGSRCGCYKGHCWAYADAGYTNGGDWWCYTQKTGVTDKQEKWQTCSQNDECSWERSCGSCRQYRREEEVHQDTCSSSIGRPLTDDCDGSRCGCYKGHCWAYADAGYTNAGDWWCYTQKAGVTGKQEKWQTCSQNDECSWERSCGNCRQYRREEEEKRDVC